jgi:hypothetical protein
VKRRSSRDRADRGGGRDRSPPPPLLRDRSPLPPKNPVERIRRSRSRDTVKSSEGRSVRSSVSPHRRKNSAVAGGGSGSVVDKRPRYSVVVPQFSLDT